MFRRPGRVAASAESDVDLIYRFAENRSSKAWQPQANPFVCRFMSDRTAFIFSICVIAGFALLIAIEKIRPILFARNQRRHAERRAAQAKQHAERFTNRYTVFELSRRLGISPGELEKNKPAYRHVSIPKQRGGTRTLAIPHPELKEIQRNLLRHVFRSLRSHPCATAFEPRRSIADNAAAHVGQAVVVKMDIVDYFPSTQASRVKAYFCRIGWDLGAATLLMRLTTHEGGLPQGAPTSPRLSNLINYVMDAQIERWVAYRKGTYTRYADDITISFPKDYPKRIRGTIQHVRRVAKRHGYTIHTRGKLRVVRQHQQQRVTGLVVNDRVNLTRAKRRWLRAVEHRLRTTGKASLTREQLDGWRALQRMIAQQAAPPRRTADLPEPDTPPAPGGSGRG
ncbi:MAG: reverse transcriptase domain-containing protein [Planctomycetota bacterium]